MTRAAKMARAAGLILIISGCGPANPPSASNHQSTFGIKAPVHLRKFVTASSAVRVYFSFQLSFHLSFQIARQSFARQSAWACYFQENLDFYSKCRAWSVEGVSVGHASVACPSSPLPPQYFQEREKERQGRRRRGVGVYYRISSRRRNGARALQKQYNRIMSDSRAIRIRSSSCMASAIMC